MAKVRAMAVDRAYVERLQQWIRDEAKKFAGDGDEEKGVNPYSRHTEAILRPYGLPGISTTLISRWIAAKEVRDSLKAISLMRIGILRGFSTDKEEAKLLTERWLSTGKMPDSVAVPQESMDEPTTALPEAIALGHYDAEQTKAIAMAAIERLAAIAAHAGDTATVQQVEVQPVDSFLTAVLKDAIEKEKETLESMAQAVGVSEERMTKIIEGYPMSPAECRAVAKLTRLTVDTLVAWGLCPGLAERDCHT